jgi:hypothetical protein
MILEVRIVKELRVCFWEVRIVKGLGDFWSLWRDCLCGERCGLVDGDVGVGVDVFGRGGWGGPGIGDVGGVLDHVFPSFIGVGEGGLLLGHGERVEHEGAKVAEGGGVALGNTILGQGGEDFAEDVVDVGGGEEIAGEGGGHFGAKSMGFQELLLGVAVEETEGRVGVVAKHAAAAAVGEGELAESGGVGTRFGHGKYLSLWSLGRRSTGTTK